MQTLDTLAIGQSATIKEFTDDFLSLKFIEMGCLPGEKIKLCNIFDVKTIPHLVILNNGGDIIDNKGRYFIQNNKDNINEIINTFNL